MTPRRLYDCFDPHQKGHFNSVDSLFDQGVWIGYLAEESRSTRYRQLPSFRELEANHRNLNFPFPKPLERSSCNDREAVCRGCFREGSSVIQLKEIRFGSHNKVVVMPLKGADDAGFFCIMLLQSLDRSIKALELFRPYEHGIDRDDNKPFANDFMLLAIRDKENSSDVLSTVRNTLDPAELARIASRNSSLRPSAQLGPRPVAEKTPQSGGQQRYKRKQQQTNSEDSASGGSIKRNRVVHRKGPKMSKHIVSLSEDDMDDASLLPNARGLMPTARVQQQTSMSPSSASNPSLIRTLHPPVVNMNNLQFTDEQAQRISFVWKIDLDGEDIEVRRTLSANSTFRSLLDSFREEAEQFPSAAQQIKATFWLMKYMLADGKGKTVLVKPLSPDFEHSFDSLLRSLAEKECWKKDRSVIVEVELRAMTSGGIK